MLVLFQIDPPAAFGAAFDLQPQSLFRAGFLPQFDCTTGADHSLPGKLRCWRGPEKTSDGSVIERIARRGRDLSVRGDRALRNRKNHSPERCIARGVGPGAIARDRALGFAGNIPRGLALPHWFAESPRSGLGSADTIPLSPLVSRRCTVIALFRGAAANDARIPR